MSGILNSVISTYGNIYLCTVADLGGGVFRSGGSGGALVPSTPFKGASIIQAETISTTLGFRFSLSGVRSQNFFTKLVVQDSAGVFRTLTTASATGFTNPTDTSWSWSVAGGTSLVWPAAGGPYFLQLYP